MESGGGNAQDARHPGSSSAPSPPTWFGVPAVPDDYVDRPRLLTLLDTAASSPFVLVSGPAGSGKTSLVASWVRARGGRENTEWLTFEGDQDALWPGVWAALARLGVDVPSRSLHAGAGGDRALLTALAMEIAGSRVSATFVFDGYELTSRQVAADLDFLLRHTGHHLHLVLVTRVDPILPLYRYRLEDTLTEVRMADLAFTDTEAAELLHRAGVSLDHDSIRALNARTHGWVAGLRFASRVLEASADADLAATRIAGDTGDIGEYLMGEVLAAQTPANRLLLLNTSIPATIQPGLAEELAGRSATRDLASLARANTFVEAVPGHPGFFRYHPFFRDLLRAELAYESPDRVQDLQRLAARWFARQGMLAVGIGHYAEIGDWAEASTRVVDDLAVGELVSGGNEGALARSLRSIPDACVHPAASVVRAALALTGGDLVRADLELARLPAAVGPAPDLHAQAVRASIAVLRSVRSCCSDDAGQAMALAEHAEHELGDSRLRARVQARPELPAMVTACQAIAFLRRGLFAEAEALFSNAIAAAQDPGCEVILVECQGYLATIACVRGRLSDATSLANTALAAGDRAAIGANVPTATAHLALAWVEVERHQVVSAAEHARSAASSGCLLGDPVRRALLTLVRSRLQVAEGDLAGAIAALEHAVGEFADGTDWPAAQLRFEVAHLKVIAGDVVGIAAELAELVARYPVEASLALAEVRLGEGDDEAVSDALSRVIGVSSAPHVLVAAWLLESERHLRTGAPGKARVALRHSLRLAAPEGLRRPFEEASPSVVELLPTGSSSTGEHAARSSATRKDRPGARARRDPVHDVPSIVVEALTKKELEVLGHLADLLSTDEIAELMSVSVNTVRTHVRNALRKLGVTRRHAAVRRARELDLLPR
jgi:LuxR family maltose regulon positive regulatory protein